MSNIVEEKSKYINQDVILGNICGSHMFYTNNSNSDIDIDYLIMPTLDSLIRNRMHRYLTFFDNCDVAIFDIRYLFNFLSDGDINKLFLLFNNNDIYINPKYKTFVNNLLDKREVIADCYSEQIYDFGKRFFELKMSNIDYFKDNEIVYRKNGYNSKTCAQALLMLKIINKYFENKNYDVKKPMESAYNYRLDIQEEISNIKNGTYSKQQVLEMCENEYSIYNSIIFPAYHRNAGWLNQEINEFIRMNLAK